MSGLLFLLLQMCLNREIQMEKVLGNTVMFTLILMLSPLAQCFGTRSKPDPCFHFRHGSLYKNFHRRNIRLFSEAGWNCSTDRRWRADN